MVDDAETAIVADVASDEADVVVEREFSFLHEAAAN